MCDPVLPALENEQYHRVVYAGLTHAFKISQFYRSWCVCVSTVHMCMLIVLLPVDLNNEIWVPVPDSVLIF